MGNENSAKRGGLDKKSDNTVKNKETKNQKITDKNLENQKKIVKKVRTNITPKIPLNEILKDSKALCKIIFEEKKIRSEGLGFFMLVIDKKCLITNHHFINKDKINKFINIQTFNKNNIRMELNNINCKFYEDLDITIIEMDNSNNIINDINFLDYDSNYSSGYNQYLNRDVFILQYSKNGVEIANGKINEILQENNSFKYNLETEPGSPIILINNLKVIGIHTKSEDDLPINYGSFIGQIIEKNKPKIDIINDYVPSSDTSMLNILNTMDNNKKKDLQKNNNLGLLKNEKPEIPEESKDNQKDKNKINSNNYIIAEMNITKTNVGRNLRIINSCGEFCRNGKKDINLDYDNEKEIKECMVEINGKTLIPFTYALKFEKEGIYKVKFFFKNIINNCSCLFANCTSFVSLDLSHFDTKKVKDMSYMFNNCSSLKNLNLSNFDTKNVTDMRNMFENCSSLLDLKILHFNTQKVNNMRYMFKNCSCLKYLDLSNFNTKNVTDMTYMFYNCNSLKNLNLSNFNTEKVIDMVSMFEKCSSLTNLNLSSFKTLSVKKMGSMFRETSSLEKLDLSNFNTKNVTDMNDPINLMFYQCKAFDNKNVVTKDIAIIKYDDKWFE